jgi:hypothetical protein
MHFDKSHISNEQFDDVGINQEASYKLRFTPWRF